MSRKQNTNRETAEAMQERTRERNLLIHEMKERGPLTVEELSKTTGIEKSKLLKHLIAMRQFGKVCVVSERDNQFAYGLPRERI